MTAECHDLVDTFDPATMRHSLVLQRLNEIKRLNTAQTWHARCVVSVEGLIAEMVTRRHTRIHFIQLRVWRLSTQYDRDLR